MLIIFGSLLILLGVISLFLPFFQGILFIVLGLLVLSYASPAFRRVISLLRRYSPSFDRKFAKIQNWWQNLWRSSDSQL